MQFNSEQLKAIRHGEGPALVIAGPGSGKTSVLTNRIKNLIEEYKVNPENILVITFSKAASVEMQNRFINLCGKEFYSVNFGTFHSVFFQIIHSVYNYNTNNILNLRQKRELMMHAIKATGVLENPENEFVDTLLNEVSGYMNSNEMAKINSATNISTEQFLMIYREYGDSKKSIGKIDFEDMLVIVRDLFRERRSVLDEYRKRFKYILIDEYQDINSIQYDIVKMLAGTSANLWVCGDDDQSIYGFRGARPEYMLGFIRDYPKAGVYRLSVNYRCSSKIIQIAGLTIEENSNRFAKNIECGSGKEGFVKVIACESTLQEYEYIEEIISKNKGRSIALLLRTNNEASRYADILRGRKIACNMREKAVNPYESECYRIFYNYLKLADNNTGQMNIKYLLPVINKPVRYIRRDSIKGDSISFEELIKANSGRRNLLFIIKSMEYHMHKLKQFKDLYSRINYIRKGIGIDKYMSENLMGGDKYISYLATADWLQDSSRIFGTVDEMNEYAKAYGEYVQDTAHDLKTGTGSGDSVSVMTFHASKGLEFDIVIIPHVNEGVVPHKKAVGEDVEEERRLFYVAMTRAKDELYISYIEGGLGEKHLKSRFLYKLVK